MCYYDVLYQLMLQLLVVEVGDVDDNVDDCVFFRYNPFSPLTGIVA